MHALMATFLTLPPANTPTLLLPCLQLKQTHNTQPHPQTQQRPMDTEVHLPPSQLLEAPAVASCMLAYLAQHTHLVDPVLDMFDIMGVSLLFFCYFVLFLLLVCCYFFRRRSRSYPAKHTRSLLPVAHTRLLIVTSFAFYPLASSSLLSHSLSLSQSLSLSLAPSHSPQPTNQQTANPECGSSTNPRLHQQHSSNSLQH